MNTAHTITLFHTYFSENFETLEKIATNKCNANKLFNKHGELMSELVEYVYANPAKLNDMTIRGELHPFCITWISNQVDWHGSPFKDSIRIKDTDLVNESFSSRDDKDNEQQLEDEFYQKELQSKLRLLYLYLTWEERNLFVLYFAQYKSLQKLANAIGVSKASVGSKVKKLKNKIIDSGILN
jgi:RNA polymerase sigma factor (sigma-70 family)